MRNARAGASDSDGGGVNGLSADIYFVIYQYIIYFYYYQNYQGAGCGYELMGYFAIDLGLVSKAWVH